MSTAFEPWRRDFDDWRAIRLLGEGGSGTVLEVENIRDGRHAALKVLHRRLMADDRAAKRFHREVQAIRQIQSDHVVQILADGVTADGAMYLVTELVHGQTLAERLKQGPLPVAVAVEMGAQIAQALATAHRAGVVHRDLKPANILLEGSTEPASLRVKIIDFGVAKIFSTNEAESHTATGSWVGTRAYMSPEQWNAPSSIDGRADLYALGVVLFESLTGEPPYYAQTDMAWVQAHTEGPVANVAARVPVPARLASLITSLLAKHPAQRPADAESVLTALQECQLAAQDNEPTQRPANAERSTANSVRSGRENFATNPALWTAVGLTLVSVLFFATRVGRALRAKALQRPRLAQPIEPAPQPVRHDPAPLTIEPPYWIEFPTFKLGRYEVSRAEYRAFHDRLLSRGPYPWEGIRDYESTKQRPVSLVSALDAQRYCAWKFPDGGRLPTVAEWQIAARSIGDTGVPPAHGVGQIRLMHDGTDTDSVSTRDMDYAQGAIGIVHLFGNVSEFAQQQNGKKEAAMVCGSSSATTFEAHRRGENCRRSKGDPDSFVGFRCAMPSRPDR